MARSRVDHAGAVGRLRQQWAGAFLLLYLLVVVWAGDTFAYDAAVLEDIANLFLDISDGIREFALGQQGAAPEAATERPAATDRA